MRAAIRILAAVVVIILAGLAAYYYVVGGSVVRINDCPTLLHDLDRLIPSEIPGNLWTENPVKHSDDFDANRFFNVLAHISMQEGYKIDYVYYVEGGGGEPFLYARPVSQKPYRNVDEFLGAQGGDASDYLSYGQDVKYLDHIIVEDTAEGYLQYALFAVRVKQFYLFGMANYNDTRILCDDAARNGIIDAFSTGDVGTRLTPAQVAEARELDLTPTVRKGNGVITVQFVAFSQFSGFERYTFVISPNFPHKILVLNIDPVVPYDSGLLY